MANRYCTVDELMETEALVAETIRLIKDLLQDQQQEINLIAQSLEQLQKEVIELKRGQE